MNADLPTPLDEQYSHWLARCDDALMQGQRETLPEGLGAPPEFCQRLQGDLALLRLARGVLAEGAPPDATLGPDRAVGEPALAPPAEAGVQRLGRFEIRRELGRGTYGVVFLAFDPALCREVALKIPRAEILLTPEYRERFLREARAAAGLAHPNLVTVYEAGTLGPVCYIASAYCPGPTLAAWLRDHDGLVPWETAARLVATLAAAIHHAHERGVLHRDLKPSNVLLETGAAPPVAGDVSLPFVPRITDFGLAKLTEPPGSALAAGDAHETRSGAILGTPAYMAPEQAAGRSKQVGPAADVYALGAILYELLTGRPPFQAESLAELLVQVCVQEPVSPRQLRPRLPRDLETICLKCLEKEPRGRYATAQALADDLGRFLRHRPIDARPVSLLGRLRRWRRRNPLPALLGLLIAVLLVSMAVAAALAAVRLNDERDLARVSEKHARQAEREAEAKLRDSHLARARAGRYSGQAGERRDGLLALRQAAALGPPPEQRVQLRNEAIACLALPDLVRLRGLPTPPATGPGELAFNARSMTYACCEKGGAVSLRSAADGHETRRLRAPGTCSWPCFSPDGNALLARSAAEDLLIWDLRDGRPSPRQTLPRAGVHYAISADGSRFVAALPDGSICLYDFTSAREVKRLAKGPPVRKLALHPDGRRLAVSSWEDRSVRVVDLQSGAALATFTTPTPPDPVAWALDGRSLAAGCNDHRVYVWDVATRQLVSVLEGHSNRVIGLSFTADGRLVSSSWDGTVRLWDAVTGQQFVRAPGDLYQNGTDLPYLVLDERQGFALYKLAGGRACRVLHHGRFGNRGPRPERWVNSVHFQPGGSLLASAGPGGVRFFDAATGTEAGRLPSRLCLCAQFRPDGRALLTMDDKGVTSWPLHPPPGVKGSFEVGPSQLVAAVPLSYGDSSICWSRDSARFALVDEATGRVVVGEAKDPSRRVVLGPYPRVRHLALSPDGRWLAAGTWHGRGIKVWEVSNGKVVLEVPADSGWAAFSPDGAWLATATDQECRLWRAGSWEPGPAVPRAHAHGQPAFSPDGKLLAFTDAGERCVRLVRTSSGEEWATLTSPEDANLCCLAFSPNGTRLAAGTMSNTIQLWDIRLLGRELAEIGLAWGSSP